MSIHQEVTLPASPERIYQMLTDSETFAAATGGRPANIGKVAGTTFSLFGDYIQGRQIELVPNKMIVQAWRISTWADGVYSMVRLALSPDGDETKVTLDQDAIPDGISPMFPTWFDHVATGWPMFYFTPFAAYLEPQAVA